jgi:hypothetical protein
MGYTHTVTVRFPMRRPVSASLTGQGFGILSEIDVRTVFEAKLGPGAAGALGD